MRDRSELVGELRLRLPLPLLIPLGALVLIGGITFGFSRILLAVPKEAATVLALAMAANVLGACAVLALRPNLGRSATIELAMVALYPVVIGAVIAQVGFGETHEGTEPAPAGAVEAAGGIVPLVARGILFDTSEITLVSGEEATVALDNMDTAPHNFAIYANAADGQSLTDPIFDGPDLPGGDSTEYTFPAPDPGEYYFQCDIHPGTMNGSLIVE
ncbi:MAG: cupredoxin domain-containing protein [Actinomycetota bacterium]